MVTEETAQEINQSIARIEDVLDILNEDAMRHVSYKSKEIITGELNSAKNDLKKTLLFAKMPVPADRHPRVARGFFS